jgi:hypothetical protein
MSKLGKRVAETRATETQLPLEAFARRCKRCEEIKPPEDFPSSRRPSGRLKLDCYCRPCRQAYQHEWYLAHRDKALAAAAGRRARDKAKRPPKPPAPERRPLPEAIGFRTHENPRVQGDAGLGIAIAYFSRIGVRVGIPLTDSQRYDLMIDDGKQLSRVQVRTTTAKQGNSYVVGLKAVGGNKTQIITKVFDPAAYEWLFVLCGDATAYLIPTTAISARYCLFLGRKYERFRLEA